MARNIVTAFITFICFLLQTTVFKALSFGGISPNLPIIITVSYGFMRGKKTGLYVGFFSGLLMDIFFGEVIGLYALLYMYIGFAIGFLHELFFKEDIKLPILLVAASDFGYNFVFYCLLFLLRGRFRLPYYFLNVMIPELVYTVIITVLLYPLLFLINRKFDQIEKRSAKKFV